MGTPQPVDANGNLIPTPPEPTITTPPDPTAVPTTTTPVLAQSHGLTHLEAEFISEWNKVIAYTEVEAKRLLAWLASKL
jgi:hypothetical protein